MASVKCECADCAHQCNSDELNPAKDLDQRLDYPPGHPKCVMPMGECPLCGALSYALKTKEQARMVDVLLGVRDSHASIYDGVLILEDGTEFNLRELFDL